MIADYDILQWYFDSFVPDPQAPFALMNPEGAKHKYITVRDEILTHEYIHDAFRDKQRRVEVEGHKIQVPRSIAVVPEHRDGWAKASIIDVDDGGITAVQRVLAVCDEHGLWAFAQLSSSDTHDGGHVYIPTSKEMDATLLLDVAARIQAAASVKGDAYPTKSKLRLPLMMHLRTPGGQCRLPLLLQSGEFIDATDPWAALSELKIQWQSNAAESIIASYNTLPILTFETSQPLHKSKVKTSNQKSVIHWFNDNHSLVDLLVSVTMNVPENISTICCPWHDDNNPSFAIWTLRDKGFMVCRCFSTGSDCPASNTKYLDAFDVYCLINNLSTSEAVKCLIDEHELGKRREFKLEQQQLNIQIAPSSLSDHEARITESRYKMNQCLQEAALDRGSVTVLRSTPGLGKTTAAIELANDSHRLGKSVAIIVPTHQLAHQEWVPLLHDCYVWKARKECCTCFQREELEQYSDAPRTCTDLNCPYRKQYELRKEKISIYQYNHLHLLDGKLLDNSDLVIVDESPLNALLEENTLSLTELDQLAVLLIDEDVPASARVLINALNQIGNQHTRDDSLYARNFLSALQVVSVEDIELEGAINSLREWCRSKSRSPSFKTEAFVLPMKARLPKLLDALEHDLQNPEGNSLVSFARHDNTWKWCWYKRHTLLKSAFERDRRPAVIVLDGSADRSISEKLYQPWPVKFVQIDVSLPPFVNIIHCPVTASTRKIVQDNAQLQRVIRSVAYICSELDVVLDGGVSYMKATEQLAEELGGTWLYYGGQRGRNDLSHANNIAIIASPTIPPDAIVRKAMALWCDDLPLGCTKPERIGAAEFKYNDQRLQAVVDLHGSEELRQAAHRCRPILSTVPTTLLIFSPWNLDELGLTPSAIVREIPHGNSMAIDEGLRAYQEMREQTAIDVLAGVSPRCPNLLKFNKGL